MNDATIVNAVSVVLIGQPVSETLANNTPGNACQQIAMASNRDVTMGLSRIMYIISLLNCTDVHQKSTFLDQELIAHRSASCSSSCASSSSCSCCVYLFEKKPKAQSFQIGSG